MSTLREEGTIVPKQLQVWSDIAYESSVGGVDCSSPERDATKRFSPFPESAPCYCRRIRVACSAPILPLADQTRCAVSLNSTIFLTVATIFVSLQGLCALVRLVLRQMTPDLVPHQRSGFRCLADCFPPLVHVRDIRQ